MIDHLKMFCDKKIGDSRRTNGKRVALHHQCYLFGVRCSSLQWLFVGFMPSVRPNKWFYICLLGCPYGVGFG